MSTTVYVPPLPSENLLWTPGVDLSAAQRALTAREWGIVRRSGARFAYAKVAEADYPMDKRVIEHGRGARGEGLLFDLYGFVHSDMPGRAQAESWARALDVVVAAIGALDLRFMIDCEDQARIAPSPSRALDCWLACAERFAELMGEDPLIYTGPGPMGLLRGLPLARRAALARYDVEIAHYRFDPSPAHPGADYRLRAPTVPEEWSGAPDKVFGWQWCGDRGPRIEAVSDEIEVVERLSFDLDRDVYFGTEAELRAWGRKGAQPPLPETLPAPPDSSLLLNDSATAAATPIRAGNGGDDHAPAPLDDDDLDVTKP